MKKIKILSFCFVLVFLLNVPCVFFASASNQLQNKHISTTENLFKSPYDLFQYWENNGYPDYVCGVWSTNGGAVDITIGILENYYVNGAKAEDLLLSAIENDNNLTIVYQKYSKNSLIEIMNEMNIYLQTKSSEIGLVSAGIYDDKNYVQISIKEEKQNDDNTKAFVSQIKHKYGDSISVIYSDEIIFATVQGTLHNMTSNENDFLYFKNKIVVFCVLSGILALFIYSVYCRRRKLLSTVNGTEISECKYKKSDVKNEIKNTKISPSKTCDENIEKIIKKIK